jgi:hypothetical protein
MCCCRYVIIGNHRDAWTFGAVDPNSGTAAMLEVNCHASHRCSECKAYLINEDSVGTLVLCIDCGEAVETRKKGMETKANNHRVQLGCRRVCVGMFYFTCSQILD